MKKKTAAIFFVYIDVLSDLTLQSEFSMGLQALANAFISGNPATLYNLPPAELALKLDHCSKGDRAWNVRI